MNRYLHKISHRRNNSDGYLTINTSLYTYYLYAILSIDYSGRFLHIVEVYFIQVFIIAENIHRYKFYHLIDILHSRRFGIFHSITTVEPFLSTMKER